MSLHTGQVADKIYLPGWIFDLPWATGQPLMLQPELSLNFAENGTSKSRLGLFDTSWDCEHNGN